MKIPCCVCSQLTLANELNVCLKCLNKEIDIKSEMSKSYVIMKCKDCGKWLKDQKWWQADWGSSQLLGICLKKLQNIKNTKILDAAFIWTEPHSKKIKLQCSIQKEVFVKVILEKKITCEFIVEGKQCDQCASSYTEHTWQSVVQVRQRVKHKKTFIHLEQLMIKYNVAHKCIGIKYQRDGLDFFFENNSSAQHFVTFFRETVPIKIKESRRLVTHDPKNNQYHYKHSFFIEICPICRYDLVILRAKSDNFIKDWSSCLLCENVTNYIHLLDVSTLELLLLDANMYFNKSFNSVAVYSQAINFFVLNNSPLRNRKGQQIISGKYALCSLELILEDDLLQGFLDNTIDCRSHLGNLIKEGDTVAGYHLRSISRIQDFYSLKLKMPNVVIVKKIFKRRRRKKTSKEEKDYKPTEIKSLKQINKTNQKKEFQRDLYFYKGMSGRNIEMELEIKKPLDELIRTITLSSTTDEAKFPKVKFT